MTEDQSDNNAARRKDGYRYPPKIVVAILATFATVVAVYITAQMVVSETDSFTTSIFIIDGDGRAARFGVFVFIPLTFLLGALAVDTWRRLFIQHRAKRSGTDA